MPDPTQSTLSLSITRTLSRARPAPLTLESLTLAHVLNGETCPPISFPDFAAFVTHKEFTTENLLFVIWFRSYQHRYAGLSERNKRGVPVPSTRLGDRYAPFAYLDKEVADGYVGGRPAAAESVGSLKADAASSIASGSGLKSNWRRQRAGRRGCLSRQANGDFQPCAWAMQGEQCGCGDVDHIHGSAKKKRSFFSRTPKDGDNDMELPDPNIPAAPILRTTSMHPSLPPQGTALLGPASQPMRVEAERAFATFLRKGGSRELGISDELRQFARETLKRSTAPECFLPIYEEIYHTIETQSLPHFLSQAKMNINRPKQLYWYFVGTFDMLLGACIFILLTLFVPQRNFGYRLTRLPSLFFTVFGAMQFYSALRGFCSQVWGRASRQVRPWELDTLDTDEEASGERSMEEVEGVALTGMTGLGLKGLNRSEVSVGVLSSGKHMEDVEELEIVLPEEVHPMSDFVGNLSPTAEEEEDTAAARVGRTVTLDPSTSASGGGSSTLGSPLSGSTSSDIGSISKRLDTSDSTEDLTDVQLRQLAIRRSTIKVPAAGLAFPISDTAVVSVSPVSPVSTNTSPTANRHFSAAFSPSMSPARGRQPDNDISPFVDQAASRPDARVPSPTLAYGSSPSSPTFSYSHKTGPGRDRKTPADLTALLLKFRRAEPADPSSYKADEAHREKSTRVFGPERLVEDPRVRRLMDRIVKEILLVGGAVGVVTVVLCFAVPMRL